MKNIIVLTILLILSGCATSKTAPTLFDAPEPNISNDKAVLYIFRDYAEPLALAAYLEIENTEVASLKQDGFTWVYVTPGKKNLKYGWPMLAGMPSLKFEFEFEPGKSYAFEMAGKSTYAGIGFNTQTILKEMEITQAKKIIYLCCRYVPPVSPSI